VKEGARDDRCVRWRIAFGQFHIVLWFRAEQSLGPTRVKPRASRADVRLNRPMHHLHHDIPHSVDALGAVIVGVAARGVPYSVTHASRAG
jgi:hypothetical protein